MADLGSRPANWWWAWALPAWLVVGLLGLGTVLVATSAQFDLLTGTSSHVTWILPSVLALAAVAAAGWALVLRHRRPQVWRRLGYGTSAALAEEEDREKEPAQDRHAYPAAIQLTSQPLADALPAETTRELETALSTLMARGIPRHTALDAIVRQGLGQPEAVVAALQQQQNQQLTER